MRTRPTTTTQIGSSWGTSSGFNPGEDFEEPSDVTDVVNLETEIPRGSRSPAGGLLDTKPVGRSPIGLEVGKSAGGGLNVTASVPIGGPISARGGINLGEGGAIKGAQVGIGIGAGPIGVSIDIGTDANEKGEGGCFQYVTVSAGPFSHTYGKDVCEPKQPKEIRDPSPSTTLPPGALAPGQIDAAMLTSPCGVVCVTLVNFFDTDWENPYPTGREGICLKPRRVKSSTTGQFTNQTIKSWASEYDDWVWDDEIKNSLSDWFDAFFTYSIGTELDYFIVPENTRNQCFPPAPLSPPGAPLSPSVPNPLPTKKPTKKKMDDKCCKALMLMLLMQHRHLGVTPISGMEYLNQFAEVTPKGEKFQGEQMAFPFEVPKVWLDPLAKKGDKILVKNISELLFIMGSQAERLERVLGTKEFIKDSEGKLRQSEGNALSWLSGKNPDFAYPDPNDFWLNTDDGIIKEKRLEVRSLTDAIRYVVEMGNRLERILPIAELKDSSIPKRWIYPGAKGQERVGNLIHLIELMVRSDDKHRGYWPVKVKVKDADPAIKGDQPVVLEFHSQADVFRELFQYLIDMEGDGDLGSNFDLRQAFQMCQMHQLTVQNNAMLDAIVEYLDFKVNKTTAKVPMPFNPFAGMSSSITDNVLAGLGFIDGVPMTPSIDSNKEADIEALAPNVLQNTIVDVDIVECDEPKTLNESLLELLKHSSAASAAVSERVSESAIDRVVSAASLAQKVTSFLLRRDVAGALGIGDLDKWITSAELGYTDSPESQSLRFPESDPLQPYSRPTTENPRIREIDTKEPKAD
ncbi:hypothetical protein Q5692_18905 [Microcoleus sp. C2C3]|uniref:hypothetical protein n=1 Tax=unclassified Microcoleus TaxID=2642155 RepID=UPI002FD1F7F5